METNDEQKLMRDAQYRKSRSIAFFNATNSAISLLGISSELGIKPNDEAIQDFIMKWRTWFLAEYDHDYKENVMTIGLPPVIMKGLDKAKQEYEHK